MPQLEKRQTGAEIEITPEMISAGVIALEAFRESFSDVWLVQAVYNAMQPLASPVPPRLSHRDK